ncbi:amino acid adenylation domain-containing protein [Streptomyces sp. WMMC500]|uniref:amino acid adenylation domain-containing protein n=1 Tax=Streptomyces sp. WMMC500 TaxID=3015154 RepID=UPI00248CF4B0|nr:amino acid adenylation domain-containing protein [Streptomyces sp. WMMC500]WBB62056.1 amino acid adenylation domain-containing protein [Streptomyces sp. WMMC500]
MTADTNELVIHRVFAEQVARTPHAPALVCGRTHLSYAEVNGRANRIARLLISRGVGDEHRVALLLEPSTDYVLAILAVLKAGGCYVPLDTNHPPARVAAVLADTEPAVVVTTRALAEQAAPYPTVCLDDLALLAEQDKRDPDPRGDPDSLAYVVHTSGSTGRPKGVMVRHRSVVRLVRNATWVRLGDREVIPLLTSICFDVSMFEIWGALLNGGQLVVAPGATRSLRTLGKVVSDHGVTTMWLTAGLFHVVVDEGIQHLAGVKQLLAGGEAPSAKHVRKLLDAYPGMRFVNGYGPTEAGIFAATHTVLTGAEAGESVPIGSPVPGAYLRVLDDMLHPVPDGITGALYIGGTGLARGYLGRPGLSAERFVPDPFAAEPGSRLYATGDLVLRRGDGLIEYLDRIDRQVKIRGFRVELGEIEATVRRHTTVRDVVVATHGDTPETRILVAYPVLEPAGDDALAAVRSWLLDELPGHLIPHVWRPLSRLPLTANGKVDRRALPAPFPR